MQYFFCKMLVQPFAKPIKHDYENCKYCENLFSNNLIHVRLINYTQFSSLSLKLNYLYAMREDSNTILIR